MQRFLAVGGPRRHGHGRERRERRRAIGLGGGARASALCDAAFAAQEMVRPRKKSLAIQVNADI
jgi:hypothetical protein